MGAVGYGYSIEIVRWLGVESGEMVLENGLDGEDGSGSWRRAVSFLRVRRGG